MSSGPEHYREAERYLRQVTTSRRVREDSSTRVTVVKEGAPPEVVAVAQVHATLALAAATGLQGIQGHGETLDYADWMEATQ